MRKISTAKKIKSKKPLARNRIKIVLAEKGKTGGWLAEEMDVNLVTVSDWCRNAVQPAVETFYHIAKILDVEVRSLFEPTKERD